MTQLFNHAICATLTLTGLLIGHQANAQAAINEKAIMAVVDVSIKEYRVYATCSALDELSLNLVKDMWNSARDEALRDLKSDGAGLLFLAKFTLATDESNILDPSTKLSEAMPYCYKNKKNLQRFYEFGHSNLAQEINKLQKKSK